MSEPTLQDCINYMRSQIKQMEKHPRNYEFNLPYYRKTVELLEKAQRPHGEWIKERLQIDERHFRSFAKCKVCGCAFKPYSFAAKEFDFCPKCGADMRGETE